ncbi:hypothetical protein AOLI_G00284000 [Acnodon oligacanthus]
MSSGGRPAQAHSEPWVATAMGGEAAAVCGRVENGGCSGARERSLQCVGVREESRRRISMRKRPCFHTERENAKAYQPSSKPEPRSCSSLLREGPCASCHIPVLQCRRIPLCFPKPLSL